MDLTKDRMKNKCCEHFSGYFLALKTFFSNVTGTNTIYII